MEIWKDVAGYAGMYQVSNTGKIKSLSRLKRGRGKSMFVTPERILSVIRNKYGYLEVILHDGSTIKHHTIHRLVATAFIPNPKSLPQINHKNEDKADNRVGNFRPCFVNNTTKSEIIWNYPENGPKRHDFGPLIPK